MTRVHHVLLDTASEEALELGVGELSVKRDTENISLSQALQVAPGLTQSINRLCAKQAPPTPEGYPLTHSVLVGSPLASELSRYNSGCPTHPPRHIHTLQPSQELTP